VRRLQCIPTSLHCSDPPLPLERRVRKQGASRLREEADERGGRARGAVSARFALGRCGRTPCVACGRGGIRGGRGLTRRAGWCEQHNHQKQRGTSYPLHQATARAVSSECRVPEDHPLGHSAPDPCHHQATIASRCADSLLLR
jgi:hypothetical protein